MSNEKQPYPSNEQLFEMVDGLDKKVDGIIVKIGQIETMLRDYNGLHEKIDEHAERISKLESASNTKKSYIPWILTGIMVLFTFLTYINN